MTFARLLREADRNRPGTALSLAMVHRLNIIPLWIQHKSGIVSRMIVSFARRAVITSAMGQRRMVKSVHHVTISGLECQVVAPSQFPGSLRAVA